MPSITEAATGAKPLQAVLDSAIDTLSAEQTVTFTLYNRLVLPLDGYVFWVKSGLTTNSSPTTIVAKGSFHKASQKLQNEDVTFGKNQCVFTSELSLGQGFENPDPSTIYIGSFVDPDNPATTMSFAFSDSRRFYVQAGIWHYIGDAIYPWMQSQVINSITDLPSSGPIVSNSLPLWLRLNNYRPFYGFGNSIPLFPSFLNEINLTPPFGTVHVVPESTQAIGSVPVLGRKSQHWQLSRETVRISLYGLDNATALSFQDCVMQRATDYGDFGLSNTPLMRDEKVTQTELAVIAQKKVIEFEINYFQQVARNIARQLILEAFVTYEEVYPGAWPMPDPYALSYA